MFFNYASKKMNCKKFCLILFTVFVSYSSYAQEFRTYQLRQIARNAPYLDYGYDVVEYFNGITNDKRNLVELFSYWIIMNFEYDLEKALKDSIIDSHILDIYEERKVTCKGYAEILWDLCDWADIESEIVTGFAKGYRYQNDITQNINHYWNVVCINKKWYIIDLTWASGYIEVKDGIPSFTKEIRSEYIFAKPKMMINTHFPLDKKWQLVNKEVSFSDFIKD
jgi:transglutaminase/protease-like cytokinesis protein 3